MTITCPPSATKTWINSVGFVGLIAILLSAPFLSLSAPLLMVLVLAVIILPITILEILFLRPLPSVTNHYHYGRRDRLLTKFAGLGATYLCVLGVFWLLPFYNDQGNAKTLLSFLLLPYQYGGLSVVALFIGLALFYIVETDRRIDNPYDGCYMAGLLVTLRWQNIDWDRLRDYSLQWVVKGFFLPLMIMWCINNLGILGKTDWSQEFIYFLEPNRPFGEIFKIYAALLLVVYTIDLSFACAGYFMTSKLLDSHIRSAQPTWRGWVACLLCYPPFYYLVSNHLLQYEDNLNFENIFFNYPAMKILFCGAILFLMGTYAWATVQFGIRFSNLTHRGIITNGPYRWTKHPAYWTKNCSWWLISLPFLTTGTVDEALRNCLHLAILNLVYFWRAKTEEEHLMTDPIYQQYAAYIAQHGMIAKLKRLCKNILTPWRSRYIRQLS